MMCLFSSGCNPPTVRYSAAAPSMCGSVKIIGPPKHDVNEWFCLRVNLLFSTATCDLVLCVQCVEVRRCRQLIDVIFIGVLIYWSIHLKFYWVFIRFFETKHYVTSCLITSQYTEISITNRYHWRLCL